jgi:2-methylcitrate dehydratase PrpD
MTVLDRIAIFAAQADIAGRPENERAVQHRHVLDILVAAAASAPTLEGRALAGLFESRALPERIGQRAATIRLSEIDDIHLPSCTTPSASAVACALSLAGHSGRFEPTRIANAIWVGTELMARIGEAVRGPDILYRGIWPSYLAAPMAAAATAARMHDLTPAQTADALSIALMLSAGGVGRVHATPSARWVLFAHAVAAGLSAVEAAAAGYHGDPGLLDGTWFQDTHGCAIECDRLAGIGAGSGIYTELSMKPFCSAKQSIAATEALRRILADGIDAAAITAVTVRVPPAYAQMISQKAQSGSRSSTLVSVARQLALRALAPARLYDIDRTATLNDAAIQAFEAKVAIMADPGLTQHYPGCWPAEVEVIAGGTSHRQLVIEAPGDPGNPLDDSALEAKAHGVLDPVLGREQASHLVEIGRHGLDDAAACGRLVGAFLDCFAPARQ